MNDPRLCSDCGKPFSGEGPTCQECAGTRAHPEPLPEIPGYTIIGPIGRGGIGEVYLARDVSLGRQVAIKFLSKHVISDPNAHPRFLREARTMATVEHPNVVRIYSFGEAGGRAYLVMEYVEGKTLAGLIHEKERLDVKDALRILEQTAEGLEAASEKQIVHRDIKPHNILIHSKGRVCVGDFGLAKTAAMNDPEYETVTEAGTIIGSPAYISPEQAKGQRPDLRSDLYSLGIVLYEMITGQRPFAGSIVEVLSNHIHTPLPLLSDRRSDVPAKVQELLNKLTEKDPARRPQSYTEVLALIRTCIGESKVRSSVLPTIVKIISIATIVLLGYFGWNRFAGVDTTKVIEFDPSKHHQRTFTGKAHSPSISPDGKWVAYIDKLNRLFVQRLDGGEPLNLFQNATPAAPMKWSPDGSQILVYGATDKKDLGLFLVPATGGEPRLTGAFGPISCWKPDGSEIVGSDAANDFAIIWNITTGEEKILRISKINENAFLQELHCLSNGTLFAEVISEKRTSFVRIDLDGKMIELFPESDFWGSFSTSDGKKLYFLSGDSTIEIYEITSIDLLKGKKPKLHSALAYEGNVSVVSVSNDGVFSYEKNASQSNLWLARLNASRSRWAVSPLTSGTWSVDDPSISPDRTRIAICVSKEKRDLYTVPLEGGSMKQITFSGSGCKSPSWSPDGNRIAFLSRSHDSYCVTVVPSEGGEVKILQDQKVSISGHMTWAPGAEIIYQNQGNRQYQFLNPDSGKTEPLFDKAFYAWWFSPRYSPDGAKLAFYANWPPLKGLWIMSRNERKPKLLTQSRIYLSRWSADGKWIYGINADSKDLYRVDASNGKTEKLPLLTIDSEYQITSMDVAPDEKTFIILGTKIQSDIWTVDTN